MPLLLFLGEPLPLAFVLLGLVTPVLADDLGDFRVSEARVPSYDSGLVVLSVKYEG